MTGICTAMISPKGQSKKHSPVETKTPEIIRTSIVSKEYNHRNEDWLGKVHALNLGVKLATREFMLFMDPDIKIDEAVLNRALQVFQDQNLDHLAILPETKHGDYFLNILMLTSKLLFSWSSRPWLSIEDRPLKAVKGVGAFNLVRKMKFDESEGFEWFKMDVADDVALAQLIASQGGRSHLMKAGRKGPYLDWYSDFNDMIKGLEKNIVGGFTNYSVPLIVLLSTWF